MSDEKIIRVSSLPQVPDCERRTLARSFPELVATAGFELREIKPSIGAAIGTSMHSIVARGLAARAVDTEIDPEELRNIATESLVKETAEGAIWDDTTKDLSTAILQSTRQAWSILDSDIGKESFVYLERELKADAGDGFVLVGHVDREESTGLTDWKSGSVRRANQAQYGGYSLIKTANGSSIERLREVFAPRVGKTKAQPAPIIVEYDKKQSERLALGTIRRVKSIVTEFEETGDPWAAMPNPNSMMCSPDFCPAHGTEFCKSHKMEASS